MNATEIKLDVFQASLVAKAHKRQYPILTVAYCKGMTCTGLAYEAIRDSGDESVSAEELAMTFARTARLA